LSSATISGVAVALGIGLAEADRDIGNLDGRLLPGELEFEVIALAELSERGQLAPVGGDEAALDAEVAAGALQVLNGFVELALGGGDFLFHSTDLGGDGADLRIGGGGHLQDFGGEFLFGLLVGALGFGGQTGAELVGVLQASVGPAGGHGGARRAASSSSLSRSELRQLAW
jgi:hypothetical protein